MPYAQVNNKELFYTLVTPDSTSSVSKSSFTVFCIHGLGSTNSFYAPVTPHLTSLGHTVVAVDTHGSGLSPYNGTGNTTTSIADDALAVLERLGEQVPNNVVALGHSMGGMIASEMALKDRSSRIKGLVLIGPVNPNPGTAKLFESRIEVVSRGQPTSILDGMEPLALSIPVTATGRRASPLVHAFIRTLLLASKPEAYISLCRAIAEARVPDYKSITAPLLIIAGDEDKSAPVEGSTHILKQYGSANKEQKVLHGVGHWHNLEAYGDVAKLVGEFVDSL